jgi:hypothetical protein
MLFGLNVKYKTSEIRSKVIYFCIEMFLGMCSESIRIFNVIERVGLSVGALRVV